MSEQLRKQLKDSLADLDKHMATTIPALVAKQWDTAADVTEMALQRLRAGTASGEEALVFLATEFRKMARP